MRDLYISLVYAAFIFGGMTAPFIAALGYVWVDVFTPQYLTNTLIYNLPVSMIVGAETVILYAVLDRRDLPRVGAVTALSVCMAIWVTLTSTWADVPVAAWGKWDWAFKTIVFSAFLPFIIRSRVQIEAFLLTWLCAASAHLLPVGIKTIVSGGGYNQALGLMGVNQSELSESSTVSAIAILMIPIVLYMRAHSVLIPPGRLRSWGAIGLCGVLVFTAVGTYARTGLVGLFVLGLVLFVRSRRKLLFVMAACVIGGAVVLKSSADYGTRMASIEDYQSEGSALTRLLVWQWTLGYVAHNPLGGGFNDYLLNRLEIPAQGGAPPDIIVARAFHSAYFEVLGEHGFVGAGLFGSLIVMTLLSFTSVIRRTKGIAELLWCRDLAGTLLTSFLIVLACSSFIGVAFQTIFWYMFALGVCVSAYAARVLSPPQKWSFRSAGTERSGVAPVRTGQVVLR